jgi:phage repressor protein C with HTH and peptisase S24 domain
VKLAIKQVGTAQLVAERSGIPKATLSGYSSGRHMSFENAIALAKATGVTLEWLATGQGPMKPGEPEKPQETPPQRPLSLWRDTHMDTLITAYATAIQTIIAAGRDETNAPGVMRLTAILYDQLMGLDGK